MINIFISFILTLCLQLCNRYCLLSLIKDTCNCYHPHYLDSDTNIQPLGICDLSANATTGQSWKDEGAKAEATLARSAQRGLDVFPEDHLLAGEGQPEVQLQQRVPGDALPRQHLHLQVARHQLQGQAGSIPHKIRHYLILPESCCGPICAQVP